MAVSIYIIKKYIKSALGKSSMTVNQDEGKCYSKDGIEGYYNNLTDKVLKFGFPGNELPVSEPAPGIKMYFSIAIFQYGLAAYDLFLLTKDESYLEKVKACAEWAVSNQDSNGGWKTFTYKRPDQLYSAMAQGEALSLLVRAHKAFSDDRYIECAHRAKLFMMKPVDEGGTTVYKDGSIYLYEYLNVPQVLNGWIFAAWGLFDYGKYLNNKLAIGEWENTVETMANKLHMYDHQYWSMYDDGTTLSNPFYHKLHIAMLNTMYDLTGIEEFRKYSQIFSLYQSKRLNRVRAFLVKVWQKILEKE